MRGDPDFIPRHQSLLDIPIERPSVGAMGMSRADPDYEFVGYVYRGTGEDQHPDWVQLTNEQIIRKEREQARKEEERAEKQRERSRQWATDAKARAYMQQVWQERQDRLTAARLERERQRLEARNYVSPSWQPPVREFDSGEPAPSVEFLPVSRNRKPPRPSPGWKPMTGADIEALLNEMEEV